MDLREEYKKEKGKWASVVCSDAQGNTYFTDDYVEWLEERLVKNCSIPDVGGSFLYELKTIAYGKGSSSERLEEIKEKLSSK